MHDSDLHRVTKTILPLIQGMCHNPGELRIREVNSVDKCFDLVVLIDPIVSDIGVVNGGASRTLNGLRGVIAAGFKRYGIRATARIEETYRGDIIAIPPFTANPNFERDSGFTKLFAQIINLVFETPLPRINRTDGLIDRRDGSEYTRIVIDGHPSHVNSIADAFYPFGIRQGRKIKIVTPKTQTTDESYATSRTRPVSR
jgi:hypothetical protein